MPDAPDHAWLRALEHDLRSVAAAAVGVIRHHAARLDALTWEHKGPADFVTEVDRAAEEAARAALRARRPDARFVGEESYDPAQGFGEGLTVVVDPLDGTTNFLHGYPWYACSVGALVHGRLAAGVVMNAATGETFGAARGCGARRNGRPIRVSEVTEPARALIGTGFPFKHLDHLAAYQAQFAAVTRATAGIRRAGAAALDLCDVACGRFEAFWELTLAPWDVAAGILIVREAGGLVTDLTGADAEVAHTPILAGNPRLHAWLLELVRTHQG